MCSSFTRPHAVVNTYAILWNAKGDIQQNVHTLLRCVKLFNALNVCITIVSERVGSPGDCGAQMGPGKRRGGTHVSGSELQRTLQLRTTVKNNPDFKSIFNMNQSR